MRSNLHKVHIFLDSHVLRGCQRHDTELLALRTDQADLLVSDLLVDEQILAANTKHLQNRFKQNKLSAGHTFPTLNNQTYLAAAGKLY